MQNKTYKEIIEALGVNVCTLVYEKLTGDVKFTRGTLDGSFIPLEKRPGIKVSDYSKPKPEGLVKYYDVIENSWRCFYAENLKFLAFGTSSSASHLVGTINATEIVGIDAVEIHELP